MFRGFVCTRHRRSGHESHLHRQWQHKAHRNKRGMLFGMRLIHRDLRKYAKLSGCRICPHGLYSRQSLRPWHTLHCLHEFKGKAVASRRHLHREHCRRFLLLRHQELPVQSTETKELERTWRQHCRSGRNNEKPLHRKGIGSTDRQKCLLLRHSRTYGSLWCSNLWEINRLPQRDQHFGSYQVQRIQVVDC